MGRVTKMKMQRPKLKLPTKAEMLEQDLAIERAILNDMITNKRNLLKTIPHPLSLYKAAAGETLYDLLKKFMQNNTKNLGCIRSMKAKAKRLMEAHEK